MSLSFLRLTLLSALARVLQRWLNLVTTRLETAAPPDNADPRQPPPPDHWIELVRQHAPQLLDSSNADEAAQLGTALVIDWRADDLWLDSPRKPAPLPKPRPLRVHAQTSRAEVETAEKTGRETVTPPSRAAVKTALRRPLRLEQVRARVFEGEAAAEHFAVFEAKQVSPPMIETTSAPRDSSRSTPPTASELPESPRRERTAPAALSEISPSNEPQPRATPNVAQSVREVVSEASAPQSIPSHYAELPFERQHIRETISALPPSRATPTIHTHASGAQNVPSAPVQTVLRPTLLPLNIEDIATDRWASLPGDSPEEPRDQAYERQRREQLLREQEGRAWSE